MRFVDFDVMELCDCTVVMVSTVLPDALVAITKVFESTVFGKRYPFTTLTCIDVFDSTDKNKSPIAPEPPIPENTI